MVSESGYQLYGEEGDDGQINYWAFEYDGIEKYNNKEYFKYSPESSFKSSFNHSDLWALKYSSSHEFDPLLKGAFVQLHIVLVFGVVDPHMK